MDSPFATHREIHRRPEDIVKRYYFVILMISFAIGAASQSEPAQHEMHMNMDTSSGHEMNMSAAHGVAAPVSYDDLTHTAALLEKARTGTRKYQDVRVAEADGYHAIGPDVPGMGIHYAGPKGRSVFDAAEPPILLYEKSPALPGGYQLVGVSYLFSAPETPDGQPLNPPFPKALAYWHRHENLCVLADNSVRSHLTQEGCSALGGHFTAETQWMVHAWIWKESPTGVFSPTNPKVQ